MPSAKLEVREDESHLSKIEDENGVKLDGSNENDIVNAKQIEIYLKNLPQNTTFKLEYLLQFKDNLVKLNLNMKVQI